MDLPTSVVSELASCPP